ncbi:MAG: stage V sporulation protein AB [Defluviitaleaceae bacterium]|nr:stage V sporulation protein AB [Defluviitaleaceae bacterium]
MQVLMYGLPILIGFSAGLVVSGAVFAFLTALGVVTRLAQKTNTQKYVRWYECAIIVGGIFGVVAGLFKLHLPIGSFFVVLIGLCIGIFYGVLAMSLAEVLNVIPILSRRIHIQRGMFFIILAISLGKLAGALLHAFIPGFYTPGG